MICRRFLLRYLGEKCSNMWQLPKFFSQKRDHKCIYLYIHIYSTNRAKHKKLLYPNGRHKGINSVILLVFLCVSFS